MFTLEFFPEADQGGVEFFRSFLLYPTASRPDDRMGLSFWHNWLADNYKDLGRPAVDLRDTYEFEIYYNIAINKWLHVTPNLQFIENEIKGDDLAIFPGIRAVIDF